MTLATHRNKHNGHKRHLLKTASKMSLQPLKKLNKNISHYVHKKPYKSIGIATLVAGAIIGFIYARMRYFK